MDNRFVVIPTEPHHLIGVSVNPAQKQFKNLLNGDTSIPEAWSAFYDSILIAIGGTVAINEKIEGWMLFTDKITPLSFIRIHSFMLTMVGKHKAAGVDLMIHIDPSYKQSERWAKMLGFSKTGTDTMIGRTMLRFEQ